MLLIVYCHVRFEEEGWEKGDGCGGVFLEKVAQKVGVCKKKSNKKHFFVENIWWYENNVVPLQRFYVIPHRNASSKAHESVFINT